MVGENEVAFTVHKSTICAKSPFFKAACAKNEGEDNGNTVHLKEVSPYSFAIYAHWIYTNEIEDDADKYTPPFKAVSRAAMAFRALPVPSF